MLNPSLEYIGVYRLESIFDNSILVVVVVSACHALGGKKG
jgi:hypothetical protein